jgi:formylglycine-generating enzyme required for sulfatase activity
LSEQPAEARLGRRYRLPTEAEWEYSCRAGASESLPFSFGGALSSHQANCDGTRPYGPVHEGPYLMRPTEVGSYPANAFGLFDMHGNVWNWCQDWFDPDHYSQSPRDDPQGPAAGTDGRRVVRGGSYNDGPRHCRSAWRAASRPESHGPSVGFRVLLEVEGIITSPTA